MIKWEKKLFQINNISNRDIIGVNLVSLNHFNIPCLHPLKHLKMSQFVDVFWGYKKHLPDMGKKHLVH